MTDSSPLKPQTPARLTEKVEAGGDSASGFHERGLKSLERAKATGVYFTAEEVVSGLEARLVAAKAQLIEGRPPLRD